MSELSDLVANSYNHNTYNIDCRSRELLQQDSMYIEAGYERMIVNSMQFLDESDYTPNILELGCGMGFPYTKKLAKLGRVVGCDVSSKQIGCARVNVPTGRFINKDVMDLHLRRKYDMIAMFHSFFNISETDKPILLSRINYWLKSYGVVLITTYGDETYVKRKEDFYGMPMIWYHVSVSDFERLAVQSGFCIVEHESRSDSIGSKETHLWTLEKA